MAALTSIMDGLSNAIVQLRLAKLRNIQKWKREISAVLAQPIDQETMSSYPTDQLDLDQFTTSELDEILGLTDTLPLPAHGDFGVME